MDALKQWQTPPDRTLPIGRISIIDQTDWPARIVAAIEELRDGHKDGIIYYDWRTNTVRIAPFLPHVSIKAE